MVLTKGHRVWRQLKPRSALLEWKDVTDGALLFESDNVAALSPREADLVRSKYTESVQAYAFLGVLRVNVVTKSHSYMVLVTECQSVGKVQDAEVFRITQATLIPLSVKADIELVLEVGKLLACGQFYFSHPNTALFDLLSPAQLHGSGKEQKHFCWNRAMYPYLERFGIDCKKWLYRIMCGGVQIHTVYAGDKQAKACLISRLSCERAGTRFHVRGVNDEGHVANFVETELAIYVDNSVASFVQTRGLVPVFWDQPGIQSTGIEHIRLSRGYRCSQPAFERHFEWCLLQYGPQMCVNLLSSKEHEQLLTSSYQDHMKELNESYCADLICFDYHLNCKGSFAQSTMQAKLLPRVQPFLEAHSYYLNIDGKVKKRQTGTVRTNCFDCLDRTNSVQGFFGLHITKELVSVLNLATKPSVIARFEQVFESAWAENGDSLSRLYAGTRAIKGKKSLMEGARSVQRAIVNNFLDGTKQDAIEMLLLGNAYTGDLGQKVKALLDPVDTFAPLPLQQALCGAWSSYTSAHKLRVCAATWNVNGGKHMRSIALKNHSMEDWLLDAPVNAKATERNPEEFSASPDIYAVGFEELVGLTASNIVSASSTNRREWGEELQRVLSRDCPYALLTAEQLVGICLFVFVRPALIPYIRDVHISTVKTGMSGNAGNKGAVAIRFLLHATSLCFVCSHLAAHQNKVGERNQDFHDICKKIQFPHGATLDSHDYVFWAGDLNYRIDLPITVVKSNIQRQLWDKLWKQDQLVRQKQLGKAFAGYIEGNLDFAPTFKYDDFSDDYDTSEKSRTPAWCDRVLWKRKPYVQLGQGNQSDVASGVSPSTLTSWDFGPHPSDAGPICGQYMDGGGALINTGHPWHPGRLLFYGRAELKTSDHRPVLAIVEIDVYKVDPKKRLAVREETLHTLGPLNPTVIVCEQGMGASLSISSLLEALSQYGKVVLVRMQDDFTLVTFQHPESALAATSLHGQQVSGVTVEVRLMTPTDAEEISVQQPTRLRVLTCQELVSHPVLDDIGESGPAELSFSASEEVQDSNLRATGTTQLEEEEEEEEEEEPSTRPQNQDQEADQDLRGNPSSSEDDDATEALSGSGTAVELLPSGDDTQGGQGGQERALPVRPPRPNPASQTSVPLHQGAEAPPGLPRNKSSSTFLASMDSNNGDAGRCAERGGGASPTPTRPQRPPAPQLAPQEAPGRAPSRPERSHTPEAPVAKPPPARPERPSIPDVMPLTGAPARPDRPPDIMAVPARPGRPSIPEITPVPARPERPSIPDTTPVPARPERPSIPDTTPVPARSERPSIPDTTPVPARPERPSIPDTTPVPARPERPSIPDTTPVPARPERPSIPDTIPVPARPERPSIPDTTPVPARPERPSIPDTTMSSKPPTRPERPNIADAMPSSTVVSRADRPNAPEAALTKPPRPERPSIPDIVPSSVPTRSDADIPSKLSQLPPARPPPPKKA